MVIRSFYMTREWDCHGTETERITHRWGELPSFFAGELAAVNQTLYRAKNQGIHQCEHWFMHSPPGCADRVQLPLNKTETAHPDR